MNRRLTTPILVIYLIYLAALAMTTALLVFWVLVVQRFNTEINQALARLGFEWNYFHLFIQSSGAGLFFLVIVALTYLLAITLSERRYSSKQAEFLSNVTHELKTPVAAIKLHAQTLQQDDVEREEQQRFLGYILQQTEEVGKLVDNLLESSRLQEPAALARLEPVGLKEFFADYQQALGARFDLGRVDLRFDVTSRSAVLATTESLRRVMDNLIDNALRYTEKGGQVLCRVQDVSDAVEIIVADNGIGIPKRELGRVFDRFYRLRREIDGRTKGTGLGLAIVRGLVEQMRGRIRAISHETEPGARFEIQLPKVGPEAAGEKG